MSTLEQRIASALTDEAAPASDLAALVRETEDAIAAAEDTANTERENALDLSLSPDPKAALAAMQAAEFTRDRLKTVLPRLQQRHVKQQRVELKEAWGKQYDEIVPRRDALARELAEFYTTLASKMVDVLSRCRALNAEIRQVRSAKPYSMGDEPYDPRQLLEVEPHARGVTDLPKGTSLDRDLVLPDFAQPKNKLWPPPTVSLATEFARSMMPRPHLGADWWKPNPEATERLNAMNDEAIAQAKARAREREERENAEADKRAREAAEKVRRAAGWPR